MPNIEIKPQILDTHTIIKIGIVVSFMELEKTASFIIDIYNDNDIIAERRYYDLTQEEYDSWGDDDNYIYNLILTHLGYERK